jgi:hypothetical protein
MIERYEFGRITVDGTTYHSDVLLSPARVDDRWWRREGHRLHPEDLDQVIAAHPDTLVVGTGYFGRMQIDAAVTEALKKAGIALIACKTKEACAEYNRLTTSRNVMAALHLTC